MDEYFPVLCYDFVMKDPEAPEMVTIPLTGFVSMPLPSKEEREALVASLAEAEKQIDRGEYKVFEPEKFLAWMLEGHPEAK